MNPTLARYQALGLLCLSARERPSHNEIKALFNEALREGDLNAVCGIHAAHPERVHEQLHANAILIALDSGHIHIVHYLRQQNVQASDKDLRVIASRLKRSPVSPAEVDVAEDRAIALLNALMVGPHCNPLNARDAIRRAISMDARRFLVVLLKHFPQEANFAFCLASNPLFKETRLILEVLRRETDVNLRSEKATLAFAEAAMPGTYHMPHDCLALRLALQCGANMQTLLPIAQERGYSPAVEILLANGAIATADA